MYTTKAQICIRRDTAANFTSANPTLALGEIAYETDTRNIKVGDGATAWTALGYINPYRGGNPAAPTSNTVLGSGAGALVTGVENTAIGLQAGATITSGLYNVAVGAYASQLLTSGTHNTVVGMYAGQANVGSFNTLLGNSANYFSSSASRITAVGSAAAALNTSSDITAVGANALDANTTGTSNVAVGKDALGANTTGGSNVAMGNGALNTNQTGAANVAIGSQALSANTGNFSTAVGAGALRLATSTGINTAVGSSALESLTTGGNNAAFGSGALFLNVDGSSNAAFGRGSLENTTTGSNNAALGRDAGRLRGSGTDALASADNSIFIGHDCRAAGNSQTNQIVIGYQAVGNGSNTTTIGNSSTTGTFIPAGDLILSGSTQQIVVGTSTIPSSETVFLGSRQFETNAKIQATGSGSGSNAAITLDANTEGNWIIQTGNAVAKGLRFYDFNVGGGSERIRFDASGNIDLKAGNLIIGTSGKGIDFSATANSSGTMTSELLSDYEEGTFTPVLAFGGASTGITYTAQLGHYTKVGRQVTVSIRVVLSSKGSATGSASITGLPFTSFASNRFCGASRFSSITVDDYMYSLVNTSSATLSISDASGDITDADCTNTSDFHFTITYFT